MPILNPDMSYVSKKHSDPSVCSVCGGTGGYHAQNCSATVISPNQWEKECKCDLCGKNANLEEVFHFTGLLHGELNSHIHACQDCIFRFKPVIPNFDQMPVNE